MSVCSKVKVLCPTVVMMLAAAVALAGSGFWITTYSPGAPAAKGITNVALVVSAEGCVTPAAVTFTGTAEGLVAGKRQSIPLKFVPTAKSGVYAVQKQWPAEGVWVLAITARTSNLSTGTVIELRANGETKALTKNLMPHTITGPEIEGALQRLAKAT